MDSEKITFLCILWNIYHIKNLQTKVADLQYIHVWH